MPCGRRWRATWSELRAARNRRPHGVHHLCALRVAGHAQGAVARQHLGCPDQPERVHEAAAELFPARAQEREVPQALLERDHEPGRLGGDIEEPRGVGGRQFHGIESHWHHARASIDGSAAAGKLRLRSGRDGGVTLCFPDVPLRDATFINRNYPGKSLT